VIGRYVILALMRLKLVLLTALLGAVLGALVSLSAITAILGRPGLMLARYNFRLDPVVGFVICLILLATASLAATFVYRHTARKRKLQAILTGGLALILSLMFYYTGAMILAQ
jgi:hypothetical protein